MINISRYGGGIPTAQWLAEKNYFKAKMFEERPCFLSFLQTYLLYKILFKPVLTLFPWTSKL